MWQFVNSDNLVVKRINEDGTIDSRLLEDKEIQEYIANGNTILPAEV